MRPLSSISDPWSKVSILGASANHDDQGKGSGALEFATKTNNGRNIFDVLGTFTDFDGKGNGFEVTYVTLFI